MRGWLTNALRAAREVFRAENYARGAALQERADLLRLVVLRSAHASWPNVEEQTLESVREQAPSIEAQRVLAQDFARAQAIQLLESWHAERPPPPPPEDPANPRPEEERARLEALWAEEKADAQRKAFGFEMNVAASTAGSGSGDGVFLRGSAPPGTLVALFPGVAYMPVDLYLLPGGVARFRGNTHLMARHDSCIFDASPPALARLAHAALACPLSVGHKLNHPPPGAAANVMPCAIDFDASASAEVLSLLPVHRNTHVELRLLSERERRDAPGGATSLVLDAFKDSLASISDEQSSASAPLRTLGFVTTQPVRDEELFLNYRLNPKNGYPPWYVPIDAEEDARRWTF